MGLNKRTRKTVSVDAKSNKHHSHIIVIQEFSKILNDAITYTYLNIAILFAGISMFCYLLNLGSNVYSLTTYYIKADYSYFGVLLAFIVLSGGMTVYESYGFYNQNGNKYVPRDLLPAESRGTWAMKWGFGFILDCSFPRNWDIIRYALQAKKAKKRNDNDRKIYFVAMIWEDAELTTLNQIISFTKSSTQLVLNFYIILKNESDYGVLSMILSILSIIILSYGLVSYDQKICLMNGTTMAKNQSNNIGVNDIIHYMIKTNWTNFSFLYSSHFFWLISRLIAFSFFTIGYGWIILPACFTHLILTFIWHLKQNYSLMDSMRLSFIHLFAYLYPLANESDKLKHPRISPAWYQTVCFLENILLMIMWTVSLNVGDGTLKQGILSVLPYPWTYIAPWIVTLTTMALSCLMFWLFNKSARITTNV